MEVGSTSSPFSGLPFFGDKESGVATFIDARMQEDPRARYGFFSSGNDSNWIDICFEGNGAEQRASAMHNAIEAFARGREMAYRVRCQAAPGAGSFLLAVEIVRK